MDGHLWLKIWDQPKIVAWQWPNIPIEEPGGGTAKVVSIANLTSTGPLLRRSQWEKANRHDTFTRWIIRTMSQNCYRSFANDMFIYEPKDGNPEIRKNIEESCIHKVLLEIAPCVLLFRWCYKMKYAIVSVHRGDGQRKRQNLFIISRDASISFSPLGKL